MPEELNVFYGILDHTFSLENQNFLKYFSQQEIEKYSRFRYPLRKASWIQGRMAAKLLLSHIGRTGIPKELNQIEIGNEDSGSPYYAIAGEGKNPLSCLSISHSGSIAFSAVILDSPGRVGVDVEKIETRADEFLETYFTPAELAQVSNEAPEKRALVVNIIWSAKEALLKVRRAGLRVDTREVEIQKISGGKDEGWNFLLARAFNRGWRVGWQCRGEYVFTLAVDGDEEIGWVEVPLFV